MSDKNLVGQKFTIEFKTTGQFEITGDYQVEPVDDELIAAGLVVFILPEEYVLDRLAASAKVELPQPRKGPL